MGSRPRNGSLAPVALPPPRRLWPTPAARHLSEATGIAVSGSAVYVPGSVSGPAENSAAYWTNGVATVLPELNPNGVSEATGIAVSGGNIYVVGYVGLVTPLVEGATVYWANGTSKILPNPSGMTSGATGIAVSGSDEYVAGYAEDTATKQIIAAYWVNGTLTVLPTPSGETSSWAEATGIAVDTQ